MFVVVASSSGLSHYETAPYLLPLSNHLLVFGYDANSNRFKVAESFEMRPYIQS